MGREANAGLEMRNVVRLWSQSARDVDESTVQVRCVPTTLRDSDGMKGHRCQRCIYEVARFLRDPDALDVHGPRQEVSAPLTHAAKKRMFADAESDIRRVRVHFEVSLADSGAVEYLIQTAKEGVSEIVSREM